jgi:hypothetical protein
VKTEQNGRESLIKVKLIVGCNTSKRRTVTILTNRQPQRSPLRVPFKTLKTSHKIIITMCTEIAVSLLQNSTYICA